MVALIITFAMLGVFFFLALYMQNILDYSPLEAGRPVPALDPDDRRRGAGRRPPLRPLRAALADRRRPARSSPPRCSRFSGIAVDSSYLDLLPGFMLLGIGIAMTMSPMTSAAMNAVPVQKAGIASGVLSMFRMVGGSLGIAVTGAIFQGAVGGSFESASPQQFVDALSEAMVVSGVVALAGAVVGAIAIRAKPRKTTIETADAGPVAAVGG